MVLFYGAMGIPRFRVMPPNAKMRQFGCKKLSQTNKNKKS
jgi:hypothetical protein